MTDFPVRGETPYGDKLKAYIDERLIGSVATSTFSGPTNIVPPIVTTLSEWTVTAPTTLTFPTDFLVGGQHTVHIVSGFAHITWPVGTEVFGSTASDEVWVTLVRTSEGWKVLVPDSSGGSGGGGDTGWITLFEGTIRNGVATYTTGSASAYQSGGPMDSPFPDFDWPFKCRIRRIGNRVLMDLPASTTNSATFTVQINFAATAILSALGFRGITLAGAFGDPMGSRLLFSSTRTLDIADGYDALPFDAPYDSGTPGGLRIWGPNATSIVSGVMEWTTEDPWPEGL